MARGLAVLYVCLFGEDNEMIEMLAKPLAWATPSGDALPLDGGGGPNAGPASPNLYLVNALTCLKPLSREEKRRKTRSSRCLHQLKNKSTLVNPDLNPGF